MAFSKKEYQDTIIIIEPAEGAVTIGLNPLGKVPEIMESKGINIDTSKLELEELPLVKFAVPKKQFKISENLQFLEKQHFQVSILPNLGTNRLMSGNVENTVSLNILGGYSHSVNGIEIGGLLNIVRNDVRLIQIAGLSNITGGNTQGVQIAGLLNNNRKSVKGVQLSLINISDTVTGASIGLLSFVRKGYHQGEISANELFYTNFSFKTGTKHFYNIFTAGLDPVDNEFWTFGYGFGAEFTSKKRFFFGIDMTVNQLNESSKSFRNLNLLSRMDLNFGLRLFRKSAIAFGSTVNFMVSQINSDTENLIKDLPRNPINKVKL